MKTRVMQAALRIALIREEFSEQDILEAVRLLEEQGISSALLAYLVGKEIEPTVPRAARVKKAISEQHSRAVVNLANQDPAKYQVLTEFDSLLRKDAVLPELSDIRRLGEQLSRDFVAKGSRKDAISKLMTLLASRSIEEIKQIIQAALSSSHMKDSEYQQLADFIITGKAN